MSEIRKQYFLSEPCKLLFFVEELRKVLPLLLQYIKIGKSLQIPLRKEHATGISAAFRTSTLPFLLSLVL